ncbi:hypothetical protein [Microbacterium algeriense]|uniref:DUF4393 domain-containing protein n=1 Tax=Microbacterium algeriense TaxID=2615184 RepID=A0ABQ6V5Y0_9MICO|nr:hypothetical protein [Microbacterium algeriense]KAB1864574.1 hypothetical protein F6A08_10775 [Microbacterium algeriense]
MSDGGDMDPIILGAVAKAGEVGVKAADSVAKETGGLLSRLLGPSADVLGQDWAERLRQKNMARLLSKTEKHAEGKADPGWAQPRVANAVFEAAQYANDEIVTDYLSGVLASSREPDGGTDDALPWSSLVSRLSALQLRIHYVFYANLRQIVKATEERQRLFHFESREVLLPMREFLPAIGLDADGTDFQRFADAMQGLAQEDLIKDYAYGDREFFTEQRAKEFSFPRLRGMPQKKSVLETPYDDVLRIDFSSFGVQFFLWGVGHGMAHDTDYLDPDQDLLLNDPDALISDAPLTGIGFAEQFWKEYEVEEDPEDEVQP